MEVLKVSFKSNFNVFSLIYFVNIMVVAIVDKAEPGWWEWGGDMEDISSEWKTPGSFEAHSRDDESFGRLFKAQLFAPSAMLKGMFVCLVLVSVYESVIDW